MGTFRATIEVAASVDGPFEPVDALVDSGATYTLLPAGLLERHGIRALDVQRFALADGRRVERPIGEVVIRIDGRTRTNVVVFGDAEIEPLLGAVTLESFALGIDPVRRQLIPVDGYLVGLTAWDSTS